MSASSFLTAYAAEIGRSLAHDFDDNFDAERFGPEGRAGGVGARARRGVHAALRAVKLQRVGISAAVFETAVGYIDGFGSRLEWLFRKLGDDESRDLLVKLVAYRALGHRRVRLPLSTPEFWAGFQALKSQALTGETIPAQFMDWNLHQLNLQSLGATTRLFSTPMGAYVQFGLQQCRCATSTGAIEARRGNFVIDGGGGWGDTALYFAARTGELGRVATFEFLPANLETMARNLALNPELARPIEIVRRALWHHSDQELWFRAFGPGTTVTDRAGDANSLRTISLSIDDFMAGGNWPRLDFIKLDIEGAELAALQGAETTLRKFRPQLAIALYHRFEDFFTLPAFVDDLGLNYQMYLRHFTIHGEETMLFARVR